MGRNVLRLAAFFSLSALSGCALIAGLDFSDEQGTTSGGGQGGAGGTGTGTGTGTGAGVGGDAGWGPELLISLDGANDDAVVGVTVLEGTDNIVALGRYTDDVGHLSGDMTHPVNADGFYLARLDDVGDEIWSDFGHTTSLGLAGVASDTDDVIVAGKGGDAIDAGGNEVALSSNDAFFFTADHGGMIAGPTAFTDAGAQVPLDVAAGVGADFILAGYFTTGVDLGGGHGIGEPDDDGAFVGAVAKTGTAQWLTVALGLGNQRMRAVTTRLGNYIVAGTTDQSTTVQRSNGVGSTSLTHPEPGVLKVFWAELDESGIPTGTGIFTGTGAQHVHDLAAAGGDGFVTVGYHNGELTIPSLGSAMTTGMRDGYAAMIHPNDPSKQWLTRLEGPLQQEITAAAVHSQAEVVIGGFYEGAATLRSSGTDLPLPDSTGNAQDMFVAGLDRATGRPLWVVTLHSEGSADALEELAVDSLGRVVVAGTFSGALTFGNRTTPDTASGLAGFVARFDPTTLP